MQRSTYYGGHAAWSDGPAATADPAPNQSSAASALLRCRRGLHGRLHGQYHRTEVVVGCVCEVSPLPRPQTRKQPDSPGPENGREWKEFRGRHLFLPPNGVSRGPSPVPAAQAIAPIYFFRFAVSMARAGIFSNPRKMRDNRTAVAADGGGRGAVTQAPKLQHGQLHLAASHHRAAPFYTPTEPPFLGFTLCH